MTPVPGSDGVGAWLLADEIMQPRRTRGTASERNRRIASELEEAGRMTDEGRAALGL